MIFFFIQKNRPNEYFLTENIKEEKLIDSGIKIIALEINVIQIVNVQFASFFS